MAARKKRGKRDIEHERGSGEEEIELQLHWKLDS